MTLSRWTLLWLLIVGVLVVIEVGVATGALDPYNLGAQVYAIVLALALIGILALVGATFLGIYVSTRILAVQEFTPFEQEMLRMREDVRILRGRIDDIALVLRGTPPERKP